MNRYGDHGIFRSLSFQKLSLTARLAVGLHCFSRYCDKYNLHLPAIDAYLDDLWEFPLIDHLRWDDWERNHPELVSVALGDPWPPGFENFLINHHVAPEKFRVLLGNVAEIVFSSFYAAADDELSMECLQAVLGITAREGIKPPPPEIFANSLYADGHGWGKWLRDEDRDRWRVLEPCP